jgi:glycosyltransferase involved in cell wall biosynthesis
MCGRYPGAQNYKEENVAYDFVGTGRDNYVPSTFCYAVRAHGFLKDHSHEFDVIVEDFAPYNPLFSFREKRNAVVQLHQKEGVQHLKKYFIFGGVFMLMESLYPKRFAYAVTETREALRKFGLGPQAIAIPNGFDPQLLTVELSEADYVLFLGRFDVRQKGLDTLAEALKYSRCRLIIAGGGKDDSKTRSLFSSAVGDGRAEFAGFVSGRKKTDLIRECLFMVLPSRYEGQPVTVIESAACGKPVIVSDIPELRYAVDAGFGLSFRMGDATDLAEKMNSLLGDQRLRQEMGRKAREYARDFSWDVVAKAHEEYLLGITGVTERGA